MELCDILYYIKAAELREDYKLKTTIMNNYSLACMIVSILGCALSGKDIPKLEKLYPELFKEDKAKKMETFRKNIIAFADARNAKLNRLGK